MKLRHRISSLPKDKHVIEWRADTEDCNEQVYQIRQRQNVAPGINWFRNLKLVNETNRIDDLGRPYKIYTIQYERIDEYDVVDLSQKEITEILKNNPDLGIIHNQGYLWIDYVGD